MPEKGRFPSLEHADATNGKSGVEKGAIWTGLVAPGEALPLAFAISVCLGAMTYLLLAQEPDSQWIAGVGAVVLLALYGFRRNRLTGRAAIVLRILLLLMVGGSLGFLAGKTRTYLVSAPSVKAMVGPVMVEGWVTAVEPAKNGVRLRIRPNAIAGFDADELPVFIRLTHRLSLNVAPGRFVRCWAVIRPPPGPSIPGDYDFRQQAWFQGLGAVGYVQGRCRGGVLGAPGNWVVAASLKVSSLRRRLATFVYQVSGERAGGFAAAVTSGDRSYMAAEDQERLRASGLAHLLAISGLHLGIVGGLIYLLFRRGLALIVPLSLRIPVQKPAAIAALLGITIYLVLSGASVSTQRAFIMSAVFFSAILFDRPALSLRSFTLALIAVVLIAPESVFAPGFRMSFAATGILIAIYEAWSRRRRGQPYGRMNRGIFAAKSLVVTSLAASFATAPYAIYHFERLAPLGLIANLLAMPVVSLLSVPAAGLALVLAPFGLAEIGLSLFGKSLELVLFIADRTASYGQVLDQPLKRMPTLSLGAFTLMLIALILFRRWLRIAIVIGALAAGALSWVAIPMPSIYWAASGDVYVNRGDGRYDIIGFAEADALGPLALRSALKQASCEEERCTYQTPNGGVLELRKSIDASFQCPSVPKDVIILALSYGDAETSASPNCPKLILWREVEQFGGLELRATRGVLKRRHALTCSARPWRQCANSSG